MKYTILLLILLTTPGFSEVNDKTPCNSKNRGRLWPEQANTDSAFARQAARCGQLEICVRTGWKHGWQLMTVHINSLGKSPKATPSAGCSLVAKPVVARDSGGSAWESEREAGLK